MGSVDKDESVPQWKRELIQRRRAASNNKSSKQLSSVSSPDYCGGSVALGCSGHQPTPTATSCAAAPGSVAAASVGASAPSIGKCSVKNTCSPTSKKMVQERTWVDGKQFDILMVNQSVANGDSDSSEELQYGPGIVSKLKNRYLSLTLREQNAKVRPSILPLRKATSLENLLDDDGPNDKIANNRMFESRMNGTNGNAKNVPNRYRNTTRGCDMKRARSVEAISRTAEENMLNERPKSIHEDVFIIAKEGNDKPHRKIDNENNTESKKFSSERVNRPKRIAPVMNEKEKPPADVVKHTKKIFEARPQMRTRPPQHTGDVAAKVATYKNIIIQTKVNVKPPLKQKPTMPTTEKPKKPPCKLPIKPTAWSDANKSPDLTSPTSTWKPQLPSPIPDVSMINDVDSSEREKKTASSLTETPDLIIHSSPIHTRTSPTPSPEGFLTCEVDHHSHNTYIIEAELSPVSSTEGEWDVPSTPAPEPIKSRPTKPPPAPPLKLDINAEQVHKPCLSPREIEKNFINASKSAEPKCEVAKQPKRPSRPKQEEQNCVVFKFTDRKEVPDYIGNDGTVRTARVERPKAGEGGITLLPGASIDESFTDYDEELLSLERPPSPCDVSFINDNILIDGRSSLSQRTKRAKMRIQFVEAVPQIFEYPSESSMMTTEEVQPPQNGTANMGHAVPSLSGSSLANYTPKSGFNSEEFQLGVTKKAAAPQPETKQTDSDELDALEEPIQFSSGTNSDILF